MKISYRTHPILRMIDTGIISGSSFYQCDFDFINNNKEEIRQKWKEAIAEKPRIYFLTKPFISAYEQAGDKLFASNLWSDVEDGNYCFIATWKTINEANCIRIKNDRTRKVIICNVYGLIQDAIATIVEMEFDYSGDKLSRSSFGWVSKNIRNSENNILNLVLITLFIKYADVEIKDIGAGQRIKGIDCKYVNETKSNVKILDSTWFTTLVKSDAFKVRGHFRLQPFKEGPKLIWINEFEKTGYTRRAGKIIDNEQAA